MDLRDQDCYFYYYSYCMKGDDCAFRHEPAALGCETICPNWLQRSCVNTHCNLRHMQLRKNRKLIPCFWENQLSGCRKPHCPFLHKYPRNHLLVAQPGHPGHVSHPGQPNHPTHSVHPVHVSHPNHPGHTGHSGYSAYPGHTGHHSSYQNHSGHSNRQNHSGYSNHQSHSGHSNRQTHLNLQNHPIMEEEDEGESQMVSAQAVMEEWAHAYEQPQENIQVISAAAVQGNQRGGNQANGGQGSMPDPLIVVYSDGMRLY